MMEPIPEEAEGTETVGGIASPSSSYSLHSSVTTNSNATPRQSTLMQGSVSDHGMLRSPPPPPDTSLASSMWEPSTAGANNDNGVAVVGENAAHAPAAMAAVVPTKNTISVEQRTERLREVHTTEEVNTVVR